MIDMIMTQVVSLKTKIKSKKNKNSDPLVLFFPLISVSSRTVMLFRFIECLQKQRHAEMPGKFNGRFRNEEATQHPVPINDQMTTLLLAMLVAYSSFDFRVID